MYLNALLAIFSARGLISAAELLSSSKSKNLTKLKIGINFFDYKLENEKLISKLDVLNKFHFVYNLIFTASLKVRVSREYEEFEVNDNSKALKKTPFSISLHE